MARFTAFTFHLILILHFNSGEIVKNRCLYQAGSKLRCSHYSSGMPGNGVDNSVYSKLMINTYDECAIEAAVQLKKQVVGRRGGDHPDRT